MMFALCKAMIRQGFLDWAEAQDHRHEFDGFQPVAMPGGNLGHGVVASTTNCQLAVRP
jgi:hypothetical protein